MAVNYLPERCVSYPLSSCTPPSPRNASLPLYPLQRLSSSFEGALSTRPAPAKHSTSHPYCHSSSDMASSAAVATAQTPTPLPVSQYRLTSHESHQIRQDSVTDAEVDRCVALHRENNLSRSWSISELPSVLSSDLSADPYHEGDVSDSPRNPEILNDISDSVDRLLDDTGHILECLRMTGQCREVRCPDAACRQGQIVFELTQQLLEAGVAGKSNVARRVLELVCNHASACYDEYECMVPWCAFFFERLARCDVEVPISDGNLDNLINLLMREMYNKWGYTTFFDFNNEENAYLKLQVDAPESLPVNNVDFDIFSLIGKFGCSAFAQDMTSGRLILLSKYEAWEETQTMLRLMARLRCQDIVTLLWASVGDSHILVCQEVDFFESLPESLHGNNPKRFPPEHLNAALNQLRTAGQFLLSHGVLYMNWTVDVLTCSPLLDRVKIGSMKCAVALGSVDAGDSEELAEDLLMKMSPYLAAPEMCGEEPTVLQASAVWAFGGLVWQLATGKHFHYSHRHISRDKMLKHLSLHHQASREGSCVNPDVATLVDQLCQMQPGARPVLFDEAGSELLQSI